MHTTGELSSAPTDTLDVCTDLLPFHLLVENLVYHAASILVTLPLSHPLERHIAWASVRYVKSHRLPLHEILHAFNVHPNDFKAITPYRREPRSCMPVATSIPKTREVAIEVAMMNHSEITVFSDGSGCSCQIGAATVLFRDGVEQKVLTKHMGSEYHHTVFEAELLGLSLAVELIKAESCVQTATIRANSQAAILTIKHSRGIPGQYLVNAIHGKI